MSVQNSIVFGIVKEVGLNTFKIKANNKAVLKFVVYICEKQTLIIK